MYSFFVFCFSSSSLPFLFYFLFIYLFFLFHLLSYLLSSLIWSVQVLISLSPLLNNSSPPPFSFFLRFFYSWLLVSSAYSRTTSIATHTGHFRSYISRQLTACWQTGPWRQYMCAVSNLPLIFLFLLYSVAFNKFFMCHWICVWFRVRTRKLVIMFWLFSFLLHSLEILVGLILWEWLLQPTTAHKMSHWQCVRDFLK